MDTSSAVVPITVQWESSSSSSSSARARGRELAASILNARPQPSQFSTELRRLKDHVSLIQQRIKDQNKTIREQGEMLAKNEFLIKELFGVAQQETNKRLAIENKSTKLFALLMSENEEFFQFVDLVKDQLFDGGLGLDQQGKLDQLSKFVKDRLQIRKEERSEFICVEDIHPVIQNIVEIVDAQKLKQLAVVQAEAVKQKKAPLKALEIPYESPNSNASSTERRTPPPPPPHATTPTMRIVSPTKIIISMASSAPIIVSEKHKRNMAKRSRGFFCICGAEFWSRQSLDDHVLQVKRKNPVKPPTPRPTSSVSLSKACSPTKSKASKHIKYYSGEKRFVCAYCPKRFVTESCLTLHFVKAHMSSTSTKMKACEHSKTVHTSSQNKMEDELPALLSPPQLISMATGEDEEDEEDEEERKMEAPPKRRRRTNRRDLPHGYSTGKQMAVIHCICGKICKSEKSLQNHINYYRRIQRIEGMKPRAANSRAGNGNKLKAKVVFPKQAAGSELRNQWNNKKIAPHREVSFSSYDLYTCACGSEHALKAKLLEHIAKHKRMNIHANFFHQHFN